MKIQGLGVDIVEIKRIRSIAKKRGSFLNRVFTDEEIRYCQRKKDSWQHFAVRFAAKEAVWKALGKLGLRLKNISVTNRPSGKPEVILNGKINRNIHLSLSHCKDYAVAQAIKVKS
ncbi:MAG TPA: holo-[acyl-carrier-protein] synthase [Elusimicrobia bacterium]|jgi:holo-[acyl-carrier protein] synthase|nr:holo-[acyl-carrier-protein] synthase [Elusimicrobiota bacterium]